eukprot:TRINITY_DN33796_c0_g1_i1.p1 TRINITY_DN33796_c0_g1~~TRINITY_DN33796_c0_g1_i1.p1  ORF type:complete len:459 (+),score=67.14 TRINITY_DN33796_c0_g1_i1:53-1378(+)
MVNATLELYIKCCEDLKVAPDPAVIGTLRTGSSFLEVTLSTRDAEGRWLALVEMLLGGSEHLDTQHFRKRRASSVTGELPYASKINHLDLRGYACVGRNGGNLLTPLLKCTNHLEYLNMAECVVDKRGCEAIIEGLKENSSLRTLILDGNPIHEDGAAVLAAGIEDLKESLPLEVLDITNTAASFHGVTRVETSVSEVNAIRDPPAVPLVVLTERNFSNEELANSISHGLATVAALFGCYMLLPKAQARSDIDFLGCFVFMLSMLTCYVSSTLYHSMYMLRRTQLIFRVLDHSAIYLLIAGTYTPMVLTNFADIPECQTLLILQWVAAFVGISLKAFGGNTKEAGKIQLLLFLGMGWAAVTIAPHILSQPVFFRNCVIIGGLFYTVGIFFFIRGDVWPMYHAVWHLFVIAGGVAHYLAIYSNYLPQASTAVVAPGVCAASM